ncbi:TPA: hypothetical protein ACSKNV_002815, partial [Listeria innocua]
FEYCGNGIPQEIWFDNMKTVVDRSKSQFTQTVFNEKFRQMLDSIRLLVVLLDPKQKGKWKH